MTSENRQRKNAEKLLPWYINRSLNKDEARLIEIQLERAPELYGPYRKWESISKFVKLQHDRIPDGRIDTQLLSQFDTQVASPSGWIHRYAILLSLIILLVSWLVVKPGLVVEWSINNDEMRSLRIYRTEDHLENYALIYEISTIGSDGEYQFVDTTLLPWGSYTYYVEGISEEQTIALSQAISGRASDVLPTWVLLITISIGMGYLITWFFGQLSLSAWRMRPVG